IVTRANIDYAERIWEEFTQSIHTFIEDKWNLSRHTSGKKRATLIVIPSIRFTKLIIHHLQRKHRFHPRPDSPLHLSNEEPVLGYLKFSAKGTKREIFGMPIPGRIIMANIREASYYQEYQENVAKHRGFLAGETVSIAISEVVTDAVDWAMQAPLCNRFRDILEADMKEIIHQRMWESDSYKSHEDHMQLFEALKKSMNRDHSEELVYDLAKARKKRKKGHESPKTPPGSPSHQPPPPPPPAGPSGTLGAPRAFGSQVTPPPPPTSTNQDSLSKGFAVPSPSKTAATTEHQAWTTPDVTLKPLISLTPEDLDMDEVMGPDEQAQLSDEEDIGSAHIPIVNLRQGWWKPFEEERPTTPEPTWLIRSSDVPVPTNNWASALASNYSPPPEDSLLAQTNYIATFMDWFCKRRGITELKPQDLEGPAYEIVKVFHPDVIHLQYQMEECHKLLTDNVEDPILRHNVSKPLLLGGSTWSSHNPIRLLLQQRSRISEIR
nr:histone deacetylase 14 [Tanacetum cinerariifolium]